MRSGGFREFSKKIGPIKGYAPILLDCLEWGPQHVDLQFQQHLRTAYFRAPVTDDSNLACSLDALHRGDDLVLWGFPELYSCLGILWALDWLQSHNADLGRVSLALDPRSVGNRWGTVEAFQEIVDARLPAESVASPLLALRRHLASDTDDLNFDLSELPNAVRPWAKVTRHLANFLPDERGLDWCDSRLLEPLTTEWQPAVVSLGHAVRHTSEEFSPGNLHLWLRLLELSDLRERISLATATSEPLCHIRLDPSSIMRRSQIRITPFGDQVRAGQADALKRREIYRWVGGRLLTNERLLRRPGAYRQTDAAGTNESEATPNDPS